MTTNESASNPPPRDFSAAWSALLASRSQPIVPAVVGRLAGEMLDEIGRLRAEVEHVRADAAYALDKAGELHVLGINQAWAEEREKEGVWPGPVSAHQYKRAAQRIEALVGRAKRRIRGGKEAENG